jgi:type II secretory pathway pseudopilin PulG
MGQQQLLLVIVGVIIVGLAIAVGIGLFSAQAVSNNRDAMIHDLNMIAQSAYQYRISIRQLGGGEGNYSNYVIPPQMADNSNGRYTILDAQVNTIDMKGISVADSSNTITATIDSNGKLGSLTFTGDFQ